MGTMKLMKRIGIGIGPLIGLRKSIGAAAASASAPRRSLRVISPDCGNLFFI